MTNDTRALRVVWFAYIVMAAVLIAAIAAVVTAVLHASALVVLSSSATAFVTVFGLGVAVYHFFRAP